MDFKKRRCQMSTKSLFAGLTVIASLSLANISSSSQLPNDNNIIKADEYKPSENLNLEFKLDNKLIDTRKK